MSNKEVLSKIATLRETKGQEQKTLELIGQLESEPINVITKVKLFWEKALVYQHLAMDNIDKTPNLIKMAESANQAHFLITNNNLTELFGDDFRFLGRVADYEQDYVDAEQYYEQAIVFYEQQNSPQIFEIKSFLSANYIRQNRVEEGKTLAKKVFNEFQNNDLKNQDVYTWAVWQTGTFPRIINALTDIKADFDHQEMKGYLNQSEQILRDASQHITWGDRNFQFRIDEINQARSLL